MTISYLKEYLPLTSFSQDIPINKHCFLLKEMNVVTKKAKRILKFKIICFEDLNKNTKLDITTPKISFPFILEYELLNCSRKFRNAENIIFLSHQMNNSSSNHFRFIHINLIKCI